MPSLARIDAFTQPTPDEDIASLLGLEPTEPAEVSFEAESLPVQAVADALHAAGRSHGEELRARSAELANEVLARAEQAVLDLIARDLPEDEFLAAASEIVAQAEHEVAQILAQGSTQADVIELRAGQRAAELRFDDDELDDPLTEVRVPAAAVLPSHGVSVGRLIAVEQPPTPDGLRYRIAGDMTYAMLLALEQAVARLPGVISARLFPEPDDTCVLDVQTADPTLFRPLLGSLPGLELHVDAA
jgi:hypothetical protein